MISDVIFWKIRWIGRKKIVVIPTFALQEAIYRAHNILFQ